MDLSNEDFKQLMDSIENPEYNENLAKFLKEMSEQKDFIEILEGQMEFNKVELELQLSAEIKRANNLLNRLLKVDKLKDEFREKFEKASKQLSKIKEIVTLDDINCTIPQDVQDICDEVLEQIKIPEECKQVAETIEQFGKCINGDYTNNESLIKELAAEQDCRKCAQSLNKFITEDTLKTNDRLYKQNKVYAKFMLLIENELLQDSNPTSVKIKNLIQQCYNSLKETENEM